MLTANLTSLNNLVSKKDILITVSINKEDTVTPQIDYHKERSMINGQPGKDTMSLIKMKLSLDSLNLLKFT